MEITKVFYQSWDTELPKVIMIRNKEHIPKDFEYKRFNIDRKIPVFRSNVKM